MSKGNYIYYGDGDIRFKCSSKISGFDIKFDGNYNLESYEVDIFLINYNNGRLFGVGLGNTIGDVAFLKYTGDLRILTCKAVTSENDMINLIPKLVRNDKFDSIQNYFNGENTYFEDLDKIGVVGEIPNKKTINIITKNLKTDGGQFKLNGKDYMGDYHLHHTGIAMTGANHTEDSEVLELKNKSKRIKNIKRVVRKITASSTRTGGY